MVGSQYKVGSLYMESSRHRENKRNSPEGDKGNTLGDRAAWLDTRNQASYQWWEGNNLELSVGLPTEELR